MKYYVKFEISARYGVDVEADNYEEAIEKAKNEYYNAESVYVDDINAVVVAVQDDNNNYIWEA